ncbi:hypothetical protein ACUP6R_000753 [Vibrio navarrensis]
MGNNAYCFCPNFMATIAPSSIIEALVAKRNSIFFDSKNMLMDEYTRVLSSNVNNFSLITILEHGLLESQKIYSKVSSNEIDSNFLLETLTGFNIAESKFLASADRNSHNSILTSLKQNNIKEIFPHNFSLTYNANLHRDFHLNEFKLELEHALYLVMSERKGKLEDEYNTSLANCLRAKRYIVLDQTLHGSSLKGINLGSLDLVIQDATFRTIIEPLKLSGMETKPFYDHLNKLLDNYNPLRIDNTFLVTYYIGQRKNFIKFVKDYRSRLDDLDLNQLNHSSTWHFNTSYEISSNHDSLSIIEQQGTINSSQFTCTHFIADFSER